MLSSFSCSTVWRRFQKKIYKLAPCYLSISKHFKWILAFCLHVFTCSSFEELRKSRKVQSSRDSPAGSGSTRVPCLIASWFFDCRFCTRRRFASLLRAGWFSAGCSIRRGVAFLAFLLSNTLLPQYPLLSKTILPQFSVLLPESSGTFLWLFFRKTMILCP